MSKTKTCNDVANEKSIFIEAINAFNDNYIWAIRSSSNNAVALVDPGDSSTCLDYIKQHNLVLDSILVTHHHQDHVGGIAKLLNYANNKNHTVTVYGPAEENIEHIDKKLSENDKVILTALDCQFTVLDLPGHTLGHIAYLNNSSLTKQPILFCGDTLFSGGCGRVFEGTHQQMYNSINKLANLADNTLVYCAHEYTQANIAFALEVEPMNESLQEYATEVKTLRLANKRTIPSLLSREKLINPFLRCTEPNIILAAEKYKKNLFKNNGSKKQSSAIAVFSAIRQWKDQF